MQGNPRGFNRSAAAVSSYRCLESTLFLIEDTFHSIFKYNFLPNSMFDFTIKYLKASILNLLLN